ncbi:MAG TPA: FtsQ-type POTRA domain-containing protein [Holophaga sp.]|nr:FtsQ-type POTRA domain-containing protein [Holophaga sp.]HPS68092.1 FtsQ-type POTRA domain-containing protein [Holophaga sp.]
MLPRTRVRRPWMPWVRVGLVAVFVLGAGYAALEFSQRYLGLQKLVIEQVNVSGCRNERLAEIQRIADGLCKGKPLFWFDAEELRQRIEERRWVKGLLIRRDPPDRLSLVIEERKPILWLVRPAGVFLLSDDGIVLDRVNQGNLAPIPVVADPGSQTDKALLQLIRVASRLRDRQTEFFDRLTELRWSDKGPVVYLEGLAAPLYLSRLDATQNIPNFQMLFLNELSKRPDLDQIRYFDLRWENEVAVGEPQVDTPPQGKTGPN